MNQNPHSISTWSALQLSTRPAKTLIKLLLFFVLAFQLNFSSKACSPLGPPTMLGTPTITPTGILINWENSSANVWTGPSCSYSIEVEVVCADQQFTGAGPFFYSPLLVKTVATIEAYPTQTISFANFCPGKAYQYRAREVDASWPASNGGWSAVFTFTTPGTFVPPTLNVTASNNIICPPQFTQLNVNIINACGGPYTYSWSPNTAISATNIANPTATPQVSTTYSVVVSGGQWGCWTATGSVPISTGGNPPAVGPGSAQPGVICTGLSTTLILSSFTGNIQWQSSSSGSGPWTDIPGGVTNSFVTGPLTANTCFQAVVSTCTGTITSNSFCVNVNQIPILAPTVVQISCSNTVATANMGNPGSSGAPVSATWSPLPITLTTQSTVATYTTPGVVTLTVSFPDGCVSTTTLNINTPPPVPTFTITNITGSASLTCAYPTVSLTALNNYTFGSLTYFWSSASFTASTQDILVSSAGIYTCTVIDPVTNCQATHTLPIYQNFVAPTLSVSPINQAIGCGQGVVATATGVAISPTINVTHSWYSPGITNPNTYGGQVSIFTPIVGTTTYVLTNNINGCSSSQTIDVISTGGTYPTFDLTSIGNFTLGCSTKSVTDITIANGQVPPSGGAVSYTLLTPSFPGGTYGYGTQNVYNVSTPGTYTVIVKSNSNNCETRIPISIIQNTFSPDLGTSVVTRTLDCYTPTVVLTGTSSTSPVTYTWSFQNGNNPNSQVSSTITVGTTTAGASTPSGTLANTYTLTIRDVNNFCITTSVVPMWQNTRPPKPAIAFSGSLTCTVFSVNLSNNSTTGILPGTFTTFQPIGGLLWQGPTPQLPKSNSSTYLAYTPGIYTLTAIDLNNGCTSQTTAVVTDNRVYPVISVLKTYSLDCGSNSLTITAAFSPSTGLTYKWNVVPGSTTGALNTPVLLTNSPGEYQIVATNPINGCSSGSLVTVVSGSLTAGFAPDKESGFAPMTVNFTNTSASSLGSSSITSIWSYGNGTVRTTTSNVVTTAVYTQPGTYSISLFVVKGVCSDTLMKVITVDIPSKLEVPNVFTPNGDNSNDIFFIKSANLTDIDAQIFDRWGNKIYELTTDKGNIAWDGKNQSGKEAPDGVYFYTIKATGRDGQKFDTKGTVSLFR